MYVLASLAEVKSIVLLTDVPQSEGLLLHLFTSFFDIISCSSKNSTGEQISKNVEYHMNSILVILVDEAQNLPAEVIDIIIAQFLRAASLGGTKGKQGGDYADDKQSTLLAKELPPAYRTAEFLCNTCSEKMARYISQYFNDVILESSNMTGKGTKLADYRRSSITADSDDEEGLTGPTEADLRELNKAHRLLRELWRASPSVLQNVIPQLEAELSAENIQLRLLATETLGDIISGIGAAGPPPPPVMDPAAYPPLMLADYPDTPISNSILTTPMSPQSFAQAHPSIYHSFIGRKNDKSAVIRSGWTTAIGRILTTSAGGIGLSREDETLLVNSLAEKLNDADERVRIAAVKAVGGFNFKEIMTKLSVNGGVSKSGSVLCSLADRARDRKHAVRVEGMTTISKIWGVAAGEILAGNENVISVLGAIPSKIFDSYYANDPDVNVLLDHVMFEQLIPLAYPPAKRVAKQANGDSQQSNGDEAFDADKIRTERILVMIRSLEPKSKKAFFAMQGRQTAFRDVLASFLKRCEDFNGGVMDENAKEIKDKLTAVIHWLVALLPDPPRATADLWKYAKLHDRRTYQLVRFAIALESDFKTVFKATREFSKRIETASGAPAGLLETMIPLIYRGSSLVYNRSHLPAIIECSRSDIHGLGATAHEVLNEISQRNPHIFKAQVKELCKLLQDQAPSQNRANDLGSVETLKACAAYARKYPEEVPHDRKFVQALVSFAQYGEPPKAAKYAVSILMAAAERKEMHAKDLLQKSTKDWTYGCEHFLTKLATIGQLCLLEPKAVDDAINDSIVDITTQQILLQVRTQAHDGDRSWQDESVLDKECQAKCLALKILVNQLRVTKEPEGARTLAVPVFKLLNSLVAKEGEISRAAPTPKHHKSRLRLIAAKLMLKLCASRIFDELLSPTAFNNLAIVSQDSNYQVRRGFIEKLQKYLVQNRLPSRFYTIIFLVNFEPEIPFRQNTITWVRSRAKVLQDQKSHVLEATLARLLSLLAHHPDYSPDPNDLADTAQYILFYLNSVANENNLGLIYKYAERVKQARDAIKPEQSENLYVMSDLAQATILKWQEKKGWNMQSFPGKLGLSKDLFAPMPNHDVAQEVAEKQYLPEEIDDLLSGLLKASHKRVSILFTVCNFNANFPSKSGSRMMMPRSP
jgi:sister chromatid cohesion protein PDS5